jgi:hypothetical protein
VADSNLVRSISQSGNVGGNAAVERFFSLKADAVNGNVLNLKQGLRRCV